MNKRLHVCRDTLNIALLMNKFSFEEGSLRDGKETPATEDLLMCLLLCKRASLPFFYIQKDVQLLNSQLQTLVQ